MTCPTTHHRRSLWLRVTFFDFVLCLVANARAAETAPLRAGMIGLDTSHVPSFVKFFNNPKATGDVAGVIKVVAGYPGGTDLPSSRDRVKGFTEQLRGMGVEIVDSIPKLLEKVDVVLLESVDGRIHLQEAIPVIKAGKPLFIDKPVAGSLRDAVEIYKLAREAKVPVFTSSSYRYYESLVTVQKANVGDIRAVISWGPAHLEPHHPDLFWYGIHPTEALFTILGPGCESVSRTTTDDVDVITGLWSGGRVGTLHALKHGGAHKVVVFGSKGIAEQKGSGDYAPLVREIMKFFQSGVVPVSPEESLAIYTFMEAADESKRRGGATVNMGEVLKKNGG